MDTKTPTIRSFFYNAFACMLGASISNIVIFSSAFAAEEKPLWELGIGIGALSQPFYTGTSQRRNVAFPVILPVYRGEVLKADDQGVRAELFDNDRYKLDISLDFSLAVDSDDVDLRADMPDIDNNLQIGPSLEITLAKNERSEWRANLPIRANIGLDSGLEGLGFIFSPNISYEKTLRIASSAWNFGASIGPQFGTADFNNVYYGVDPEFATASRPSFQASSGYSGSRLQLSMTSKNSNRLWVWFLRYENISGASFDESPLVETNDGLTIGLIYSRKIWQSKKRVSR